METPAFSKLPPPALPPPPLPLEILVCFLARWRAVWELDGNWGRAGGRGGCAGQLLLSILQEGSLLVALSGVTFSCLFFSFFVSFQRLRFRHVRRPSKCR